jgi:hypothetical protein
VLDVIGAGFGRTGTDSLRAALDLMGYGPCHHMRELFANPASIRDWLRAAEGNPADWRRLLGDYRSTVDWPSVSFWRELVAAYPAAKVLLTVRDPQAWYDSMANTLYSSRYESTDAMPPAVRERFEAVPELQAQPRLVELLIWQGTFAGRFTDREYAIEVYHRHVAAVREHVPAERLLIFDVAQGWAPLCEFLGVDVPDTPFPRLNTSTAYRDRVDQLRRPDGRRS